MIRAKGDPAKLPEDERQVVACLFACAIKEMLLKTQAVRKAKTLTPASSFLV